MNFKKKNVLTMLVLLMAGSAFAGPNSELGQSLQGPKRTEGIHEWVGNKCMLITESNAPNELIVPVSMAIKTCPRKRDYTQIINAYAKIKIPSCSIINEFTKGELCITEEGFYLKHAEDINGIQGFQDLASNGKIWYLQSVNGVNQQDAIEMCRERGQILPSKEDFLLAKRRGLGKALKNIFNGRVLWTSSIDHNFAYVYSSARDDISGGSSGYELVTDFSGLCVSAASVN